MKEKYKKENSKNRFQNNKFPKKLKLKKYFYKHVLHSFRSNV